MRSRLGGPKAITPATHKASKIVYNMLRHGKPYVDSGASYYEVPPTRAEKPFATHGTTRILAHSQSGLSRIRQFTSPGGFLGSIARLSLPGLIQRSSPVLVSPLVISRTPPVIRPTSVASFGTAETRGHSPANHGRQRAGQLWILHADAA